MSKRYIFVKKRYIFLFSLIDSFGATAKKLFFFKKRSADEPIRKIAVIELAHIGDVLAITPALSLLKKKFPDSSITVIAAAYAKEILGGNSDIDEILVYRAPWFERGKNRSFSFSDFLSLVKVIRSKSFDLGIDLRGDFRSIFLMWLGKIKKRMGYAFCGGSFLLTDVLAFDVDSRQNKHQVEHNIDFILSIKEGKSPSGCELRPKFLVSQADSDYVNNLFIINKINPQDFLIAIHPGAGLATKRWPAERFAALIKNILANFKVKIILVGGKEDADLLDLTDIKSPQLLNLTGKTNLTQLAALLKKCNLFIGGDSGVTHVAASQKIPIIAIWGGQNKPSHWKPLTGDAVLIHKETNCSPCGLKHCPKDLNCLKNISLEEVFNAVSIKLKDNYKTRL